MHKRGNIVAGRAFRATFSISKNREIIHVYKLSMLIDSLVKIMSKSIKMNYANIYLILYGSICSIYINAGYIIGVFPIIQN